MNTNRLIAIFTVLVSLIVGILIGYHLMPEKIIYREKPQSDTLHTTTTTKTDIKYVYKDKPNDADVVITQNKPKVEVNGKEYVFDNVIESNKFDKGKLEIEQGYFISIKTEQDAPKWGLDIGTSNHGIKTGLSYRINKHLSVYGEGTLQRREGKDRYYGAGIKIEF